MKCKRGPQKRSPFRVYARHGRLLGGESPLEEEIVLTPSRRQLRHREVGWEGSRSAKPCTDEQKSRRRHIEVGELACDSEARHCQQLRCVDVAAVGRKWSFLSGEICLGVASSNMRQHKTACTRTEVSRRHSTDRGSLRREGLNIKSHDKAMKLASWIIRAANPASWACDGTRR